MVGKKISCVSVSSCSAKQCAMATPLSQSSKTSGEISSTLLSSKTHVNCVDADSFSSMSGQHIFLVLSLHNRNKVVSVRRWYSVTSSPGFLRKREDWYSWCKLFWHLTSARRLMKWHGSTSWDSSLYAVRTLWISSDLRALLGWVHHLKHALSQQSFKQQHDFYQLPWNLFQASARKGVIAVGAASTLRYTTRHAGEYNLQYIRA